MNSGSAASTDDTLYASWQPYGVWQGRLSGAYGDGLFIQDDVGFYWSSTAVSIGLAYSLYLNSGGAGPGYDHDKYTGYAVRCAI